MADLLTLPTFDDEEIFRVVVESPRGSTSKFKYDKDHGVIALSRPLPAGLSYPHDWGFVPSTLASDGDPLDAIVAWDGRSYPGVVIPCRAIGVLQVEQRGSAGGERERNDRVVALPANAPRRDAVGTIFDLSDRVRQELEQFFLAAVAFESKALSLCGWAGPAEAVQIVKDATRSTLRDTVAHLVNRK
jgi:inorganic pyrophosphatase